MLSPALHRSPDLAEGSLGNSPRPDKIDSIAEAVSAEYGVAINPGVIEAVKVLQEYYRSLINHFELEGINTLAHADDGSPVLSEQQQRIIDTEFKPIYDEIEVRSEKLAEAASKVRRKLTDREGSDSSAKERFIPLREDTERYAHAIFTQRALKEELSQSPFASWVTAQVPQGGVVSIAILLNDAFLRAFIASTPELKDLAARHPIFPQTFSGFVIEKALLSVPAAEDHRNRLADLENLKFDLATRAVELGLVAPGSPIAFGNIACGTGIEDAWLIERLSADPASGPLTLHLLDLYPQALEIARARIQASLNRIPSFPHAPAISFGCVNVQSERFGALLSEDFTSMPVSLFQPCHLQVAAGIDDYLVKNERRALNIMMALALEPHGFGLKTQVLHHPNEHQQEFILGWRINYDSIDGVREQGRMLKEDLDALRSKFSSVPAFAGIARPDLVSSKQLCKNPGLLNPGEYCVVLTEGGTNSVLIWRLD